MYIELLLKATPLLQPCRGGVAVRSWNTWNDRVYCKRGEGWTDLEKNLSVAPDVAGEEMERLADYIRDMMNLSLYNCKPTDANLQVVVANVTNTVFKFKWLR